MAPCNDAGPAFLLDEIGPTCHPLHIKFLLVYSNIYTSLEIIPCQTIPYPPYCVYSLLNAPY